MPVPAEPTLDKLIGGALELIGAIEVLDLGQTAASTLETAALPSSEKMAASMSPLTPTKDGYVEVVMSEDAMTVEATFHCPTGGGAPLTLEDVQAPLVKRGVVFGIDWNVVTDALENCNAGRLAQTAIAIARGEPTSNEVPPRVILDPDLLAAPVPATQGEEALDHRILSPFVFVSAGQVLGHVVPRVLGVLGTNVRGGSVQYRRDEAGATTLGRNVGLEGTSIVARKDGRFVFASDVASVADVLKIPGDVDYGTGHVDFPGDVIVEGHVKIGFKVKAGGSLVVNRVISATEVLVGQDLVAKNGILGRGTGIVRVMGQIHTGFIENCYVEAHKAIRVRAGCLNSAINTLDRLETGARGAIVGGSLIAQNGVKAAQIGNASGSRTEIRAGVDFLVSRKLEWIRDKSIALAVQLRAIERAILPRKTVPDPVEKVRERLRATIRKLAESARALSAGLDRNEDAEVEVTGTVHPGTYIEICGVPFMVERALRRVRIGLSKKLGRVIPRPL